MRSLTREQIELLAEKKLRGVITPEERALLDEWLGQEPEEWVEWNSDDADERALGKRLLDRIKKDTGITDYAQRTRPVRMRKRHWRPVAAAILLLLGGGMCFLAFPRKSTLLRAEKKIAIQPIAPGHRGAVLILADGHKIVLDSSADGKIAVQGDRRLIKKNKALIYERTKGVSPGSGVASKGKVMYNTLETPRGREFEVVLPDGSKAWLNAASSITYPTAFTGKERKVTMTGEIYFEVANDSRYPFIVLADRARITVLGTHFDVMAYRDEKQIKTTLLEGSVKVSRGDRQVVIAPGQQASLSVQSDHLEVREVDARQTVAWMEGKLSLDNLNLQSIMRNISRWYDVDVTFNGPIPEEKYWGLINRNVDLPDMLKVMRAAGIHARFENNKITISSDH